MSDEKKTVDTIKEAAALLDRHPNSVYPLIKQGPPDGLAAEREGKRKYKIELSEIDRFKRHWRSRTRE